MRAEKVGRRGWPLAAIAPMFVGRPSGTSRLVVATKSNRPVLAYSSAIAAMKAGVTKLRIRRSSGVKS